MGPRQLTLLKVLPSYRSDMSVFAYNMTDSEASTPSDSRGCPSTGIPSGLLWIARTARRGDLKRLGRRQGWHLGVNRSVTAFWVVLKKGAGQPAAIDPVRQIAPPRILCPVLDARSFPSRYRGGPSLGLTPGGGGRILKASTAAYYQRAPATRRLLHHCKRNCVLDRPMCAMSR